MNSIAQSNKLLVVSGNLSQSDYLSLLVLIESLRLNKEITHIVTNDSVTKYSNILPFTKSDKLELKDKIAPRKFILSFNKGQEKVKNVQWHQTEKEVSLYVSMENGEFKPEGMNFRTEGSDYDAVLYFNVANFAQIASVFEPYKNLPNEAKNIAVGKPVGIEHQEVEFISEAKASTLAENVYELVKDSANKVNFTRLLAALLLETNRFQKPVKGGTIFQVTAKLVEGGADLNEANALIEKMKSAEQATPAPKENTTSAPAAATPKPETAEANKATDVTKK